MKLIGILLLQILVFRFYSQAANDILPSVNNFKANWQFASELKPYRSTIYTNLSPLGGGLNDGTNITAAISRCTSNQVILLASGSYEINDDNIIINRDGVTVRGATNSFGIPTAILNFTSATGGWGAVDISKANYPDINGNVVSSLNISSGLAKGSTQIIVTNTPASFTSGQVFYIDGFEYTNHVTETEPDWSDQGGAPDRRVIGGFSRPLSRMFRCTTTSSTTVNFEPPIDTDYFEDPGIVPQMYWYDNNYSETVRLSSVEDVMVIQDGSNPGCIHNIAMGPASECWARNVWTMNVKSGGHGFTLYSAFKSAVVDCMVSNHLNVGSATYSIRVAVSGSCLVQNNIMQKIPCAISVSSGAGHVIFGNFATNFPYQSASFLPETMMFHGNHVFACLWEANYVPKIQFDNIHGNASYTTVNRNRLTGWEDTKTSGTFAFGLQEHQFNMALLGNVLGTDGYHTGYTNGTSNLRITEWDGESHQTATIKLNYNTVDDGLHAGETSSDTNAFSYVFDSAPAWWGDRGWPWVKSDFVSTSLDPIQATNQPAGFRLLMSSNVPSSTASSPASGPGNTGNRIRGIRNRR